MTEKVLQYYSDHLSGAGIASVSIFEHNIEYLNLNHNYMKSKHMTSNLVNFSFKFSHILVSNLVNFSFKFSQFVLKLKFSFLVSNLVIFGFNLIMVSNLANWVPNLINFGFKFSQLLVCFRFSQFWFQI